MQFGLPYGTMLTKTKTKIAKKCQLKISKIQNSTILRPTEKKIQKRFEKIQK